ncbi:uncharacterized protein PAC_15829 [Phialocephala subalpina]|uniref:DUF1446 domain protein n=1 Tax=Phialocephala subalpina TaxID=576137 RepID=A0A1L7XLL6_9HELO|nr:uncharacterized protein PAC_15829 [Phialocephala subalpina]
MGKNVEQRGTRPLYVGNVAGSSADRLDGCLGMLSMLRGDTVIDVITGDWLAEVTLAALALNPQVGYEASFLDAFNLALESYLAYPNPELKIIVNAGALKPQQLAIEVQRILDTKGAHKKVAYVTGDNILGDLDGIDVQPLTTATGPFPAWREKFSGILSANAYIGCWGIVEALNNGADIVICGRCTDASPTMGAATWWHRWQANSFDQLAGSLVAGHLIECGCYVTGGNFCGFQEILPSDYYNISFPIAVISQDGTTVIEKQPDQNGIVTVETVKSQLLYELQDVIGDLSDIECEQVGPHQVRVFGTKGLPGPEMLKAAILSLGGYQAEFSVYATGLHIEQKAKMFQAMAEKRLEKSKFQTIEFQTYGVSREDPQSQLQSTVQIRQVISWVFAQAAEESTLLRKNFLRPVLGDQLQCFPGLTQNFEFRSADPKTYCTYFPGLVPASAAQQRVHFLHKSEPGGVMDESAVDICNNPVVTKVCDLPRQVDIQSTNPVQLDLFGDLVMRALGEVVYARSGDKGANVNVGFYCPGDNDKQKKWDWLRSFLTTEQLRLLLKAENHPGMYIERCEFEGIRAVHFVLHGILGAGVSSSSKMDALGKVRLHPFPLHFAFDFPSFYSMCSQSVFTPERGRIPQSASGTGAEGICRMNFKMQLYRQKFKSLFPSTFDSFLIEALDLFDPNLNGILMCI